MFAGRYGCRRLVGLWYAVSIRVDPPTSDGGGLHRGNSPVHFLLLGLVAGEVDRGVVVAVVDGFAVCATPSLFSAWVTYFAAP